MIGIKSKMNWVLQPYMFYLILALALLLPLLKPGYILTLDMVFTPHLPMPEHVMSSYLFHAALHVLNLIIPSQIIQKILLLCIVFVSGISMHVLLRHISRKTMGGNVSRIAAYVSGAFYAVNPFTYSRFMAGQYAVLLGYACLPFFALLLFRFIEAPSLRSSVYLGLLAAVIGILSIHTLGLLAVFTAITILAEIITEKHNGTFYLQIGKYLFTSVVVFAVASSYWLLPTVFGDNQTATAIQTFRHSDQSAFATSGSTNLAKIVNVLRLQGFWAERQDLYLLPRDVLTFWNAIVFIVWGQVITGMVWVWRHSRRMFTIFGLCLLVAVFLASGVLNGWLSRYIPLFAGYREPQKFAAIIALCYALFSGFGISGVLIALQNALFRGVVLAGCLVVWVAFTPVMFGGFDGQLVPRQYPSDWYAMNTYLRADRSDYKVLFLPWHLYMRFRFAGRVIANPADDFFSVKVVASDNPELSGVQPAVPDPEKTALTTLILPNAASNKDLATELANLKFKYVLLAKDADYRDYRYIDGKDGFQLVKTTESLNLYRNNRYAEKF